MTAELDGGATYYWRVSALDYRVSSSWSVISSFTTLQVDACSLAPNYPNPFNPATQIPFAVATPDRVQLSIYDALGRRMAILLDREMPEGLHEVQRDASRVASGLYFYRLNTGGCSLHRRMLVVR